MRRRDLLRLVLGLPAGGLAARAFAAEPPRPADAAASIATAAAGDPLATALAGMAVQSQRLVKNYAWLTLSVSPSLAAATLRQAAEALGRAFVAVTAAAGPRVPSARLRELSLRERALRDGSRTRPDRELARLLDEVGEQLLVRLDALSRTAPRAHARRVPPGALIVRDVERQRLLVHRLAKMHAVQCLGFDSIPAPLRLAMRAEFGHRLASFDPMARSPELQTELAMLRAQWGLLTVALDSNADGGCGGAALAQVAASSEWLAQLLEEFGEAARRPQA